MLVALRRVSLRSSAAGLFIILALLLLLVRYRGRPTESVEYRAAMAKDVVGALKSLPALKQRKAAAILGALAADAAAMPLHWIYDQSKVQELTQDGQVAFHPTSHNPFYRRDTGYCSAYGDAAFVSLQSIHEKKGFDAGDLSKQIYKFFGPDSEYEPKSSARPLQGPWRSSCYKPFLASQQPHPSSADPDGLVRAIPIVALLAGQPHVMESVETAVRLVQSSPVAVGFALGAAHILEHVILTGAVDLEGAALQLTDPKRQYPFETDPLVAEAIQKGLGAKDQPHSVAVKSFGLACGLPPSFHGMVHGIATARGYREAVLDNIMAAGDTCSRGCLIGACVAAASSKPLDSIPMEWLLQLKNVDQVLVYVKTLVDL